MSEETCPICGATFHTDNRTGCEVRVTVTIPGIQLWNYGEQSCCEHCMHDLDRALRSWKHGLFRGWRNMLPDSTRNSFFTEDFPTATPSQNGSDESS